MPLPPGFKFGVATAGFQIEGGYNGRGQPANNWADWESSGKAETSGVALDFWNCFEHHLDRTVAAGCNAFRLGVEWARCVPRAGEIDEDAFDRYCRILDACHDRNLQPLVTLHHFTHPAWLGDEFWLRPDSPERYLEWARLAVDRLAGRCSNWVTLNEINIYALQTWLTGMFPPGRRLDIAATVRTLDHMLCAHVLAYDEIKRRQPQGVVSTNNFSFSLYELDRLLIDVVLARSRGIGRYDLGDWLRTRRSDYYAALSHVPRRDLPLRRFAATTIPLEKALPRSVAAVYSLDHERALDAVQIDYYDPVVSHHLRLPGHRTAGGRNWLPGRMLWDDPPNPDGLVEYCKLNADPGLDVWIVENGLCNRVVGGRSYPRLDGWNRVRYLTENLAAVERAVAAGVPVTAYYHWTLADNYEWGSYEPRFGLYGIERNGDSIEWKAVDSMGDDAAGMYRSLIEGMVVAPR